MPLIKQFNLYLGGIFRDAIRTITSWERIRQLWANRFYTNSLYLIATNALGALLGFVFWIVAARLYSTEEVGLASAVISAVGLMSLFSCMGLTEGVIRFLPKSDEDANKFINTIFSIVLFTSLLTSIVFLTGLGVWSPKLLSIQQNIFYYLTFVLLTVFFVLSSIIDSIYVAGRRAGFVFIRGAIFNTLKLALVIAFASYIESVGIVASWGVSLGIAFISGILILISRIQPAYRPTLVIKREVVSTLFKFSMASYSSSLLWSGTTMLLPIIVVNLLGAEANAYFYIAWSISTVLTMIPSAISTSLFAEGSNNQANLGDNVKRSLKMVSLLLIPSAIILFVLARWLLSLFNTSYADNSVTLLRFLVIAALPAAINVIYINIKKVEKELKTILLISASLAVLNIGLSYILLPRIGINGAGIAWLSSHSVVAICIVANFIWRRKSSGLTTPSGNIK
jgi:O-antigen/teichoic acid export membrane protein